MPQNETDEELVALVRTSNKELFRILVERYQKPLFSYAKYLIHDEDKAKDAVQQAFIKAYRNLQGFDTKKKFSSWIYRITHNEAINIIKKYKKETDLPNESLLPSSQEIPIDELLENIEQNELIQDYLDAMPLKYREILVLYFIEEKSYEEISDILRIPLGTVGIRISRGKDRLRDLLKKKI